MTTATASMTREEAVQRARDHWGADSPFWSLDGEGAHYSDSPPAFNVYGLPTEPYWYVPLRYAHLRVGSSHAVLVFVESGRVRTIEYGE